MKEFNIGDKVRVRKDLKVGEIYGGVRLNNKISIDKFLGRIVTISRKVIRTSVFHCEEDFITYRIKEDNEQLIWNAEMFEEIKEETINNIDLKSNEKIEPVILNNGITTVCIKDKGMIRKGESKWNKKDKYDKKIGILIATARALKFDEKMVQDFIKAIFKEEDKKENIKKEEIKKEPKLSLVSSNGTECDFEFREEFNELVQDMSEQILNKLNSSNIPKENKIKVKIIEPKNNRGGIPRIILEDADLKNSSPKSECNCTCKTKNKESNKKEQENQTKANNSSSSKEELSNLLDKEIDKLLFLLSTLNLDKNRFNFWDLF